MQQKGAQAYTLERTWSSKRVHLELKFRILAAKSVQRTNFGAQRVLKEPKVQPAGQAGQPKGRQSALKGTKGAHLEGRQGALEATWRQLGTSLWYILKEFRL